MILRRRVLDYALAVLLLLVPVAILHSSLKEPDSHNGFDEAVLRVSSPLQAAVSWIIGAVGDLWTGYVWLVDVEDENDELRADNRRLRSQLAAASRLARDGKALEDLAGLRTATAADTMGARVVSSTINPYFRVLRIGLDRGQGEVEPGMPVISTQGLVGRINKVYGDYADVLLISDPGSAVDVTIARTGGRGVLVGLGQSNTYACKIDWLDRDVPVRVGDRVVTSGLGSAFPAGIAVGHIRSIATKDYGLYQEVEVTPLADVAALDYVMVLLAPTPPPDPNGGETEVSAPAEGVVPF